MNQAIEKVCLYRIKDLLQEWAGWQDPDHVAGFPRQVSFASERVQDGNRSTETYRVMPDDVARLNTEINKLAPNFKRIIALEYLDRRPQKAKASQLAISREMFSVRLRFVHEQLHFVMFCL